MVELCCRFEIVTTEGATLGRWRRGGALGTLSFGIDHERGFMDGGDGRRGRGSLLIRLDGGSPFRAGHASKDDFSLVSLF